MENPEDQVDPLANATTLYVGNLYALVDKSSFMDAITEWS